MQILSRTNIKMEVYRSCVLLVACAAATNAIMWNLEPNSRKCLKEELLPNVPVVGEFEVSEAPGQTVEYVVSYAFSTTKMRFDLQTNFHFLLSGYRQ